MSTSSSHDVYTSALLADGRVLTGSALRAELYDPATGAFTPAGDSVHPLAYTIANLLPTGQVLLAWLSTGSTAPVVARASWKKPGSSTRWCVRILRPLQDRRTLATNVIYVLVGVAECS
jgi:hypothetical protein